MSPAFGSFLLTNLTQTNHDTHIAVSYLTYLVTGKAVPLLFSPQNHFSFVFRGFLLKLLQHFFSIFIMAYSASILLCVLL